MQSSSRSVARRFVAGQRQLSSSAVPNAYPTKIEYHGGKNTGSIIRSSSKPSKAQRDALAASCNTILELNERQSCDVELLVNGGFSPLDGFMNKATYDSVVQNHRLKKDGPLFGLPVVLDAAASRDDIKPGKKVLLRYQGTDMAVLDVTERFTPNKPVEALKCYKTTSIEHPGVRMIAMEREADYVAGSVTGLDFPTRPYPCKTPEEVRDALPDGVTNVVFQCRNPVHRAHYELFTRALDHPSVSKGAVVLVHPTMGPTQEDDISGIVRYKTYQVLQAEKPNPRVHWAFLPYSMHMAGPREALQHMILRKNHGCNAFIVGRDMAGSKSSITGEDYYSAYEAQDFAAQVAPELGMITVPSLNLVYTKEEGYCTADVAEQKGLKLLKLSGTEFRRKLRAGEEIPDWFAFKSVVDVLRREWN